MGEAACFNLPPGETVTVYLGLGSNIGERGAQLQEALTRIGAFMQVDATSSIYETAPVGFTEQPEFWNMVVRGRTDLPARQLLHEILAVEAAMGRARSFRNAPRNIDIDVLLYDDVVMADGELQIPHERMHERAFVLRPLLEIAPDLTHPRTHERFADYLRRAPDERVVAIAPPLRIEHETR